MKRTSLILIALLATCIALITPVLAETQEKVVLYETDFSSNPDWTSNNPRSYYWDAEKGMYHYYIEGATGGYAYKKIDYNDESFTLEFDLIPMRTDPDAAFRFGLGSQEMDVTRATNIYSEFSLEKSRRLMSLVVITQNNNMVTVSSDYNSYCGEKNPGCVTKEFADNTSYHVVIRHNAELQRADIKVTDKETGIAVWGYFVNINQDIHFLDRLLISSKGVYLTGASAEGYIDNVQLYTFRTPVPTTVATPLTRPPTLHTTAPPTKTPTPTPTSPAGLAILPLALAAGALVAVIRQRRI